MVWRRRWAVVALVAQALFVLSWLVAGTWQGPRYSLWAHSISDMYAVGAPHGWFLVVALTLCGAATAGFALASLRPVLRHAGWPATLGAVLLALSILGLGDLLSPFERESCRRADPGCSAADQLRNLGGVLDGVLSTVGLLFLVAAGFLLAAAMGRSPGWSAWSRPTRVTTTVVLVLMLATVFSGPAGLGGLFERLLAVASAGLVALLALAALRSTGVGAAGVGAPLGGDDSAGLR